jgi:prophage regulatory protein
MADTNTPTRLIRLPEVKLRTGLARSSIYRMMDDGTFPSPRKLGPRAVAWLVNDIDAWIDSRPAKPDRSI